ncbi:MAG: regulatory protein GemA [Rhodocyclaceae bacterium]|nr:regulatory protein GemA [Rhodocyclaceae bacterium]
MSSAPVVLERRRALLGLAHKAAAQLGMDEETRRAAQAAFAGRESLKDFTDRQLIAWCWELKRRGADIGIPAPPPKGGLAWDRPTPAQWATIERLSMSLGLTDAALSAFVRRTTGLDDARFLTRRGATEVITGLEKWARSRGADTRSKTESAIDILSAIRFRE